MKVGLAEAALLRVTPVPPVWLRHRRRWCRHCRCWRSRAGLPRPPGSHSAIDRPRPSGRNSRRYRPGHRPGPSRSRRYQLSVPIRQRKLTFWPARLLRSNLVETYPWLIRQRLLCLSGDCRHSTVIDCASILLAGVDQTLGIDPGGHRCRWSIPEPRHPSMNCPRSRNRRHGESAGSSVLTVGLQG